MKIFLTGANGYLGRLLAREFARMPEVELVTGIDRDPALEAWPAKMRFQQTDIRSPEVARLMVGHDVVVHTACIVLWPARMSAAERDSVNLEGTRNVAEAALRLRVPRFIHASSMAVYDPVQARGQSQITEEFPLGDGRSRFYYWNAKAEQERILTRTLGQVGVGLTLLRPIYIMGPNNRAAADNYRTDAVNLLGHNPRRQFIHEADVVSAFVLAVQRELLGAYNVTPDDYLHMRDVWRIVGAKRVPTVPLVAAKWLTWLRWRLTGFRLHPCWVEDMLVDFTGSNAKLKRAGWSPKYNSEQSLRASL